MKSKYKQREIDSGKVVPFRQTRNQLAPLDLLLFKGGDFVSDIIRKSERLWLGKGAGEFSHVGLVVTRNLLPDNELLKWGELYIWESTISGKLGQGVKNVEGRSFLGVQLRKLDDVIEAYDSSKKTRVAWCPLLHPLDTTDTKITDQFTKIFKELDGRRYDANMMSLGSSLFSCMRRGRRFVEMATGTGDWLFCSELAALVYKEMGILPPDTNEKNVVPVDFIGYDKDGLPVVVETPPKYVCWDM